MRGHRWASLRLDLDGEAAVALAHIMRITLSSPRTGIAYFPGLARPQSVDVGQLPAAIAGRIEASVDQLVNEQDQGSTEEPRPERLRDDVLHHVIVEGDDGGVREISGPPVGAMRTLIDAVRDGLRAAADEQDR